MTSMRFETLYSGQPIPVLGLGTWDIGGGSWADYSRDGRAKKALRSAIQIGYTHFDTAEIYGRGHTEELLGEVIAELRREDFFITTKVSQNHLRYREVIRALEGSLSRLKMEYVDLYLIHWPNERVPLDETFEALNWLVESGQVRYLGVSNFNLQLLKRAKSLSNTPIVTNQVPYSVNERRYAENGVLAYCQENGILLTAYSPLKGGVLRNPQVQQIARARGATPAQVALSWLLQQPTVITIPKSSDEKHLRENYAALDVELSEEEMNQLNRLK